MTAFKAAIRRTLRLSSSISGSPFSSSLSPPPHFDSPVLRPSTLSKANAPFQPTAQWYHHPSPSICCRFSSSFPPDPEEGPAPIDYRTILREEEYHKLADNTIHNLQEKLEEYGDQVQIDGFDIDYGNQVLTLKLGSLGTYVINKQTPNRQIWLSSPISGPSRYDWDSTTHAWTYRRTNANLLHLLEDELGQLCGEPINLS